MAQKIKVQDGIVSYSTTDPADAVDFTVAGQVNVRDDLVVGSNALSNGVITTPNGTALEFSNLDLTTGSYGTVNIYSNLVGGNVLINNAQWPTGATSPNPGMYLGSSALNVLEYYPFILGFSPSDTLTVSQLNAAYATAQAGQYVAGPTVVYQCVGSAQWRTLGSGGGGSSLPDQTGNAGKFLSTDGTNASWAAPSSGGGYPTLVVDIGNPYSQNFSSGYWALSSGTEKLSSTEAYWDEYAGGIILNETGYWRVTVRGRAGADYLWPNEATTYGTFVSGALDYQNYSQYYKTATGTDATQNWGDLPVETFSPAWTDDFIIKCEIAGQVVTISMYANAYSGGGQTVTYSGIAIVQRISAF